MSVYLLHHIGGMKMTRVNECIYMVPAKPIRADLRDFEVRKPGKASLCFSDPTKAPVMEDLSCFWLCGSLCGSCVGNLVWIPEESRLQ